MARTNTLTSPLVKLVSMPWTSLTEPSLGLAILRAELDRAGIPARVMHLNLFLLEHLRSNSYYSIANVFALNDFLFSGVLDPELSARQRGWLRLKTEELLTYGLIDTRVWGGVDGVVTALEHLRQETLPVWLAGWADRIVTDRPSLVGLTCMFDQTIASLALARLIKARAPQTLIALGGYAVREPTGTALLRAFPEIDVVCEGEGESVIVPLAEASCGQRNLADVPGIHYRSAGQLNRNPPAPAVDLNTVPTPNFDDYFADLGQLADEYQVEIEPDRLPIENSRGCWWGQKHHCIFCGIHDDDLAFRARDAQRVLDDMAELSARYGTKNFRFADYILPYRYFSTLLPALIAAGSPYRISSEIKANLSAKHFALLAAAGFEELQPGIESFASSAQRRMGKGVNAMQSIHTLLLGKRHGVSVRYNILYGLPDDTTDELDAMLALMPRLRHLDPPSTRLPVQITRYAPLQTTPARFGIDASGHDASYELIFSDAYLEDSGFDLDDFCYYYERSFENAPRLRRRYIDLEILVDDWKYSQKERPVRLAYRDNGDRLSLLDTRGTEARRYCFHRIESDIYRALAEPVAIATLREQFAGRLDGEAFDRILADFDAKGVIFAEAGTAIALALPDRDLPSSEGEAARNETASG